MRKTRRYIVAATAFAIMGSMGLMQTAAEEAQDPEIFLSETISAEETVTVSETGVSEMTTQGSGAGSDVTAGEAAGEAAQGADAGSAVTAGESTQESADAEDAADADMDMDDAVTEIFSDALMEYLGDGFDARSFIRLTRDLSYGSRGDDVRQIQERLIELGYDTGDVDGVFGNITKNAVMAFQRDRGLYVDGIIGNISIASMNEDAEDTADDASHSTVLPILSRSLLYGSTGSDVLAMQKVLLQLGYAVGPADGEFGSQTENAVYAFQRDHGLIVDGWVGDQTWDILRKLTDSVSRISQGTGSSTASAQTGSNVSLSIYRDLSIGSNGNDVRDLQKALEALGFDVGGVDGQFGNRTNEAVLAFQRKYNLYVDGVVGQYTISSMKKALGALAPVPSVSVPVVANVAILENDEDSGDAAHAPESIVEHELSYGSTGDEVKDIQNALIRLGYLPEGCDDGIYGNMTRDAVKAFQSANGAVDPSGKVDAWTIEKFDGKPIAKSEVLFNKVISTGSGDYNFTRNVSYEMEGDDIELIQDRLVRQGYLAAIPAGYYGNMTYDAIMAFQKDAGLAQTGSIDVNTLVKLFSNSAPKHADPSDTYTASSLVDTIAITDKNYDREGHDIKYIIPHHMAGRMSGENCAYYFVNNGLENSANYCIGYNGDIALGVPEDYGAWTSSWWAADEQGITIEVSDTSISDWTIPDKAQDALVDLCVDLFKRNPTLGNRMIYDESDKDVVIAAKKARDPSMLSQVKGNVLLHNWTSGGIKDCPGEGMLRVLPDIVKRVNDRLK